ncbi:MAG: hypothetical protein ABI577_04140 [bacterium]
MKKRFLSLTFAIVLALTIVPATAVFAQEHGDGETANTSGPHWSDVKEVAIWSMVSIAAGATVLGVLYLFKRRIGGFPEHPVWVAPITIMRAGDLPGDDADPHGHDAADSHGSHAPAH